MWPTTWKVPKFGTNFCAELNSDIKNVVEKKQQRQNRHQFTMVMSQFGCARMFVTNSEKFHIGAHIFSFPQRKIDDWAVQQSELTI